MTSLLFVRGRLEKETPVMVNIGQDIMVQKK